MNRDEVKRVALYIVDNYNTERMDIDDDKRMDDLTDECCRVIARKNKEDTELQAQPKITLLDELSKLLSFYHELYPVKEDWLRARDIVAQLRASV